MRAADRWAELLQIDPAFAQLESDILHGRIDDYRQIPPQAFAWQGWDLIHPDRLFAMLLPFLRGQIRRARQCLPALYGERLSGVDPEALRSPVDWQRVPLLVKDDDPELGLTGFRSLAQRDPLALRPDDLSQGCMSFGSGGSLGAATPTFVTLDDRGREIHGWRRGHRYHGLEPGDVAVYTYNTTHKGGQWMQESLWAHGVQVGLRRPEEGPEAVLDKLGAYGANLLFTVQQPYAAMTHQAKAAGINLHSLVIASLENPRYRGLLLPDAQGRRQVEFIFLGGFPIVPYALELAAEYLDDVPVATLLGSSEAIPQACSTHPGLTPGAACHHNHLHLLPGPHYVEVVKPAGQAWAPVAKGERGWLVYTSWARDGTLWLRYAPGDAATLLLEAGECPCGLATPVISEVQRINPEERDDLLFAGCAAG